MKFLQVINGGVFLLISLHRFHIMIANTEAVYFFVWNKMKSILWIVFFNSTYSVVTHR